MDDILQEFAILEQILQHKHLQGQHDQRLHGRSTGSRRPTILVKDAREQAIESFEREFVGAYFEDGLVVDSKGNEILHKKGARATIVFDESDIEKMRGNTLIHNHPTGSSFSPEDVLFAVQSEMAEIIAVGIDRETHEKIRYSIQPHRGGKWPLAKVVANTIGDADYRVQTINWLAIREGTLRAEQANARHWHQVWTLAAEQLNLDYSRTVLE